MNNTKPRKTLSGFQWRSECKMKRCNKSVYSCYIVGVLQWLRMSVCHLPLFVLGWLFLPSHQHWWLIDFHIHHTGTSSLQSLSLISHLWKTYHGNDNILINDKGNNNNNNVILSVIILMTTIIMMMIKKTIAIMTISITERTPGIWF